jgi:predicted phage terminase large subunit-like protein
LFKRAWFGIVDTLPVGLTWVRAWDLAGTVETMKSDPDWTVGVKMGIHPETQMLYIAHVVRAREDPGGVDTLLKNTAEQDGRDVRIFLPQDPGQAGKAQINHYVTKVLQGFRVSFETMQKGKKDRADPLASQAKAGNVKLYRAGWNEEFLTELEAFPSGSHDDQVDAASSAYTTLISPHTGLLDFMRQQAAEIAERQRLPGENPTLR